MTLSQHDFLYHPTRAEVREFTGELDRALHAQPSRRSPRAPTRGPTG
jgi:hypothetical protein